MNKKELFAKIKELKPKLDYGMPHREYINIEEEIKALERKVKLQCEDEGHNYREYGYNTDYYEGRSYKNLICLDCGHTEEVRDRGKKYPPYRLFKIRK